MKDKKIRRQLLCLRIFVYAAGLDADISPKTPAVSALYSRVMLWAAQVSIISSGQMLACTSPMCALPSRSMQRRLWPMPPPMV